MSRAKHEIMKLRASEIEAEKANLVNLASDAVEKVVAQDAMDYGDEPRSYLEQVQQHGCQSGMVSGLIYYNDTVAFYNTHESLIWDKLNEESESMGADNIMAHIASFNGAANVGSDAQFKNLLAWWAYETAARDLLDRLENQL